MIQAKQKVPEGGALGREVSRNFAVLAAVLELCPAGGLAPTDGVHESDSWERMLTFADVATRAGVSRTQVRRALHHFRTWRVLWVRTRGSPGAFEVRFERPVLRELLIAHRWRPGKVKGLMEQHRKKREAIAPLKRTA